MGFRIKHIDGGDEDHAEEMAALNELAFVADGGSAPKLDTSYGDWWLVYDDRDRSAAFAGLTRSTLGNNVGYLKRTGVVSEYRGYGLQRRLIRVREVRARRLGLMSLVTDTTDNNPSANNLIRCGYTLFTPRVPWAFATSLYWRKTL